jgi:putative transposase
VKNSGGIDLLCTLRGRESVEPTQCHIATFGGDSPWENGYIESFNGKLRDELLNGEIFYSLREAQVVIEQWRRHYNTIRPHSSLGYRPPAPEVITHAVSQPIALRPPLN